MHAINCKSNKYHKEKTAWNEGKSIHYIKTFLAPKKKKGKNKSKKKKEREKGFIARTGGGLLTPGARRNRAGAWERAGAGPRGGGEQGSEFSLPLSLTTMVWLISFISVPMIGETILSHFNMHLFDYYRSWAFFMFINISIKAVVRNEMRE